MSNDKFVDVITIEEHIQDIQGSLKLFKFYDSV